MLGGRVAESAAALAGQKHRAHKAAPAEPGWTADPKKWEGRPGNSRPEAANPKMAKSPAKPANKWNAKPDRLVIPHPAVEKPALETAKGRNLGEQPAVQGPASGLGRAKAMAK
jgi:hypothetical protein